MLGYGYDPALSEGAVKPPVFLTSTFVFRSAEDGRDFFDYVVRPARAAGRRLGRAGLFALQPPQQRDRRGPAGRLRGRRGGAGVLLRHGGDRHLDPRHRPAGRRDPAQPAAVRRHRDAADENLRPVRHRRRGLRRRHQRGRDRRRGAAGHGQGPGLGDPDRDAVQPDEHAGRFRPGRAGRRRHRRRRRGSGRW